MKQLHKGYGNERAHGRGASLPSLLQLLLFPFIEALHSLCTLVRQQPLSQHLDLSVIGLVHTTQPIDNKRGAIASHASSTTASNNTQGWPRKGRGLEVIDRRDGATSRILTARRASMLAARMRALVAVTAPWGREARVTTSRPVSNSTSDASTTLATCAAHGQGEGDRGRKGEGRGGRKKGYVSFAARTPRWATETGE